MPEKVTPLGRVGPNPRGEYDPEQTYDRHDIVQSGGSGWWCLKDGTKGIEPAEGDNWMKFADNGGAATVEIAKSYADAAKQSQDAAKASQDAAGQSATTAEKAKDDAKAALMQVQTDRAAVEEAATTATTKAGEADKSAQAAEESKISAAADAQRAEDAAKRAQSIAQGQQGYFATAALLREKVPSGEDGYWAIVGETDTIWVWDSDHQAWSDSGNKTDLSKYYTRDETDGLLAAKADADKMTAELNKKADADTTTAALADKASKQDLTDGLAAKADADTTATALADKASKKDLSDGLATKVNSSTYTSGMAGKQDKLTFDDAPAAGSDNSVKSGAVYTAVQSALSSFFDMELRADGWADGQQTLSDPRFTKTCNYTVGWTPASYEEYNKAGIYPLDVTVEGQMTFKCKKAPAGAVGVRVRAELAKEAS